MEAELVSRLMVSANSTIFPSSRITQLVKDAHFWATSILIWLELVKGKTTTSIIGQDYYDYPQEVRTGTLVRLELDGKSYDRKNFEDYLAYKNNNPSSTKRIFASYGRQYFIWPVPTTAVASNLKVWGAVQADDLTSSSSKTIFSLSNDEGNECIVKKALSVAMKPIDANLSAAEEKDATAILQVLNKKQWDQTGRDQRIQHPFFVVPDYFGNGGSAIGIGNFSLDPDVWGQ